MNSSHFTFRKIEQSDRSWIESFIIDHWGNNCVVVHNSTYYPSRLDGFVAFQDKERVGLITYQLQDLKCEIVTLNSLIENSGIGSRLVTHLTQKHYYLSF